MHDMQDLETLKWRSSKLKTMNSMFGVKTGFPVTQFI